MVHGLSCIANKVTMDDFEKEIEKSLSEIFVEMSAIWVKGVTN